MYTVLQCMLRITYFPYYYSTVLRTLEDLFYVEVCLST